MPSHDDVLILGGGVAGLAAAAELHASGLSVRLIEARERLGGRVWTIHPPGSDLPIELGAEFIHGKPPELFSIAKGSGLEPVELGGENFASDGKTIRRFNFFRKSESVLDKMDDRGPDRPFAEFVREHLGKDDAASLQWAMRYVRGFHAANPALISVHAMVREARAEEKIEGDKQFRPLHGYAPLIAWYERRLAGVPIQLGTAVHSVQWGSAGVRVLGMQGSVRHYGQARMAVITLPLGVLQADTVVFEPELPQKRAAACRLAMGKVVRVVLRFRDRFWEKPKEGAPNLEKLHFLMSDDPYFPTWWSSYPIELPLLVGWAPDDCADALAGKPHEVVVAQARESLEGALPQYRNEIRDGLVEGYFHDWQADPLFRGAYSYVKAGGFGAQQALGAPVEDVLFFAGEATEWEGHHATVHGAIATGLRAAREVRERFKK